MYKGQVVWLDTNHYPPWHKKSHRKKITFKRALLINQDAALQLLRGDLEVTVEPEHPLHSANTFIQIFVSVTRILEWYLPNYSQWIFPNAHLTVAVAPHSMVAHEGGAREKSRCRTSANTGAPLRFRPWFEVTELHSYYGGPLQLLTGSNLAQNLNLEKQKQAMKIVDIRFHGTCCCRWQYNTSISCNIPCSSRYFFVVVWIFVVGTVA